MTANATRNAFGKALLRLGGENPNIVVLDADLSESTRSAWFGEEYPDRFYEMGIQEANMLGTAAGLAECGKIAFCCSFSCFVTSRFDQIKVSVGYNNANVTIVGTHAGCGVGPDGYTQMALEDIACLRTLPNMQVIQPADDVEATQVVEYLVNEYDGPAFLRLTRQKIPQVHGEDYKFQPGKADILRDGADLTIVATGACVGSAMEAAERLEAEGVKAGVVNLHTIQPIDAETLGKLAAQTGKVMTVEDHGISGGMGSAVCEALAETTPARVWRVGVKEYGESGDTADLYAKHHLDADGVYLEAKAFLGSS